MQQIVVKHLDELQNACVDLVTLANKNGGEDNITVVLVKFSGDLPESDGELEVEHLDLGGIHDTADQDTDEVDTAELR